MYITETPDAGVVCFVFIVWKLVLVVVCVIWRIRLLLYMHDEKTQQFIFCSLSMHISQRNVPKGGCNRVDTTHTYTPARPFTRAPLDIIAVTAQDVPLPARCTSSGKFYLEEKGATILHGAVLQVWCHIQACAKQSCCHTDFHNLKKDHNHVHYLSV